MRLLKIGDDGELNLTKDLHDRPPPYAILSHTWGEDDDEVTFQDLKDGLGKKKVGFKKIQFCAEQVTRDGLEYFWVDTCCIDKSNNAELSEAIISMFRWYLNATKCYVHLADVSVNDQDHLNQSFQSWGPAFRKSRWFTRGWTLQELLAPPLVEFFSTEGKLLGDKKSLERQIHEITRVAVQALQGRSLSEFSATERFSWAESRETKRAEDKAYSLIGIFNVSMPPLYGEGIEKAYRRLREEVNKDSNSTHNRADRLQSMLNAGENIRNEASSWNLAPKSMNSRHEDMTKRLLQHLSFPVIRNRKDRITKAMEDTFEWIYRRKAPDVARFTWDNFEWIYRRKVPDVPRFTWDDFVGWLQNDAGLYWIAGKAGSGKSTLMKFLHSDPRTKGRLKFWAKDSKIIISGHFFWNSGSSIQMSIEGLIRTLLHGIGSEMPSMLPDIFPDRWAEMESSLEPRTMALRPWDISECLEAFRRILFHPFDHFRFLFFIDGLDECSGDHEELAGLLREMAASSHIKMCLASRPWNVFQDAFSSSPSLMLQHLTYPDIHTYVHTKFHEHRGFKELEKGNRKLAARLCNDITQKASGVFLWVRLAVQSLLRGIANGDRVIDLIRRLDGLPEDLEMLFRKILDSVDPAYKVHSAQLFQIQRAASEWREELSLLRFSYADDDDQTLWDNEDRALVVDEAVFRVRSMARRLDSRTKGLLETLTPVTDGVEDGSLSLYRTYQTSTVQYMHRTLKDYIEQPEVWNEICSAAPLFNPYASLCKACALEIKGINCNTSDKYDDNKDIVEDIQRRILELTYYAMYICTRAGDCQSKPLIYVLDALDATVARKLKLTPSCRIAEVPISSPLMISLAIRHDLYFWVEELLNRGHPTTLSQPEAPFIFFAVDIGNCLKLPGMPLDMDWGWGEVHPPSLMCLETLLSHGADPCEEHEGATAWSFLIYTFSKLLRDVMSPEDSEDFRALVGECVEVTKVFISHGVSIPLLRNRVKNALREFTRRNSFGWSKGVYLYIYQRLCQTLEIGEKSREREDECEDECENVREEEHEYGDIVAYQDSHDPSNPNSRKRRRIG